MRLKSAPSIVLLLGCTAVLQYHAIHFWVSHTDPVLGAAWSILIEGAALWMLSNASIARRVIGGLVTVLSLSGPLYQVSEPLIAESLTGTLSRGSAVEQSHNIADEIRLLETALNTYLTNSVMRNGWQGRIDRTQSRLEVLRAEQSRLSSSLSQAPRHQSWQRDAVIIMQAISVIVFQMISVLAVGDLRRRATATAPTAVESLAAEHTKPDEPDIRVAEIITSGAGDMLLAQSPVVSRLAGQKRPLRSTVVRSSRMIIV